MTSATRPPARLPSTKTDNYVTTTTTEADACMPYSTAVDYQHLAAYHPIPRCHFYHRALLPRLPRSAGLVGNRDLPWVGLGQWLVQGARAILFKIVAAVLQVVEPCKSRWYVGEVAVYLWLFSLWLGFAATCG